jgi:hypothetical protein
MGADPLSSKRKRNEPEVVGFLGVGFDNQDGHQRVTQSEHFLLLGGSEETHEKMQDTAARFGEALKKLGKTLRQTSAAEAADLLHESMDS